MHTTHMRAAIALSRRGLGSTWPNPAVGCVIVHAGRVVGQAVTAPGGRPHAETQALAQAGAAAQGATAYVTLEPCAHTGQTPPCAEALIAAGIARVIVACTDPDPRVSGAGVARLRDAGVAVEEGVLREEATDALAGFFARIRHGRPLVTLKLASTLDGKIATRTGESQWITGEPARKAAHALRGQHDATMAGVGTVLSDDPDLTCRIPGYTLRPTVRVIADSHLRTPLTARVVATAGEHPTWILHREEADPLRIEALTQAGVRCIAVAGSETGIDAAAALLALGDAGLTRVLLEGGAQLAASVLRADLVDRVAWFHAPAIMGGDGWPATQATGIETLDAMPRFRRVSATPLEQDMLTRLTRIA
jgi:diaminohydroxyphosphoribosylaminopyrimidine deaminase/5-amino-6-(5-phosphoribosylamino)uracil reductase